MSTDEPVERWHRQEGRLDVPEQSTSVCKTVCQTLHSIFRAGTVITKCKHRSVTLEKGSRGVKENSAKSGYGLLRCAEGGSRSWCWINGRETPTSAKAGSACEIANPRGHEHIKRDNPLAPPEGQGSDSLQHLSLAFL